MKIKCKLTIYISQIRGSDHNLQDLQDLKFLATQDLDVCCSGQVNESWPLPQPDVASSLGVPLPQIPVIVFSPRFGGTGVVCSI